MSRRWQTRTKAAPTQLELEAFPLEDVLNIIDAALEHDQDSDDSVDEQAFAGGYRAKLDFEPRPYQQAALEAWQAADGRGVVVLPTGAGKTVLALMTIAKLKVRTVVVVPTIELLHQWHDSIIKQLGIAQKHVGMIGDGKRQLKPITVITYASAAMPNAPIEDFGLLICDEVHHLPSESYSQIAKRTRAPYRLGLTATPERSDGRHNLLTKLLGPEVYRRSPSELSEAGHIAQFKEKRLFVDLEPQEFLEYETLMTIWKTYLATNRHALAKDGDFFGALIKRAGSDPRAREALQAHHKARMLAMNAKQKLIQVADLLDKHRNDKVIIFSEYNDLVYRLSWQFALPAITYRTSNDERKAILHGFRAGMYSKLVTGRVLNEGVDVPDANIAIVVSGSSTTREYIQRLGRVLRKKPTEALLYEIITRNTSEVQSARRRRKAA